MFNSLMIFHLVGIQIQQYIIQGESDMTKDNAFMFFYIMMIITFFFNIVAVIVSFYAYKKFKIEFIRSMG